MNDKTLTLVSENELAIGIQVSAQIAGGRQVTMTTGVPLDWEEHKIKHVLNKIAGAMDHLHGRYTIEQLERELEVDAKQLVTARSHREFNQRQFEAAWEQRNKRGPWKPDGQQEAALRNADATIQQLSASIAERKRKLAELREQKAA